MPALYENGCGRWQSAACSCLHCKLIYIVLYTYWGISFQSVSDPFEEQFVVDMDGSQEIEMEEKSKLKTAPRGNEVLEDLLIELGGFGNYQKRLFCLLVVFLFAAIPLLQNTQARSSVCWWSLLEERSSWPNFGISDFLKVNRSVAPFQSTQPSYFSNTRLAFSQIFPHRRSSCTPPTTNVCPATSFQLIARWTSQEKSGTGSFWKQTSIGGA